MKKWSPWYQICNEFTNMQKKKPITVISELAMNVYQV